MKSCDNCGQSNMTETNFCRFCGTRFTAVVAVAAPAPASSFDFTPPRPYAWKTDEFQTNNEARRTDSTLGSANTGYVGNGQHANQMVAGYPQFAGMGYRFSCTFCGSTLMPKIEKRISTGGWITFAVLLVFFFPLFWIGLLIKEEVQTCQACNRPAPRPS